MRMKRYKPDQVVNLLRQIEVEIADGKTAPQACKEAGALSKRTTAGGGENSGPHPPLTHAVAVFRCRDWRSSEPYAFLRLCRTSSEERRDRQAFRASSSCRGLFVSCASRQSKHTDAWQKSHVSIWSSQKDREHSAHCLCASCEQSTVAHRIGSMLYDHAKGVHHISTNKMAKRPHQAV